MGSPLVPNDVGIPIPLYYSTNTTRPTLLRVCVHLHGMRNADLGGEIPQSCLAELKAISAGKTRYPRGVLGEGTD